MANTLIDYSVVHPVPGLGRNVDYLPTTEDPLYVGIPFPNALSLAKPMNNGDVNRAVLPLTTIREFSMLSFMNAITDKEDWHVKVLDDEIARKWRSEVFEAAIADLRKELAEEASDEKASDEDKEEDTVSSTSEEPNVEDFAKAFPIYTVPRNESATTVDMAAYCINELRHKAKLFHNSPHGAVIVFNGDVVKSDSAVTAEVKFALQDAVRLLESLPDKQKDWHPGSDEKVLDLVHPSLFPFVYGRSKVLQPGAQVTTLHDFTKRCGEGEQVVANELTQGKYRLLGWGPESSVQPFSNNFQWLPCDVDISGPKARITSYVNNLHPEKYSKLYGVVEDVITAAIPLWELTLAPMSDTTFEHSLRITYAECVYDPDPASLPETEGPQPLESDEYDDEHWERREEWIFDTRRVVLPEPNAPFDPSHLKQPAPFNLRERFAQLGRPLQVIVKLANIELTPEKPTYDGGSWHVEGKFNEHIVATAIYYYSSSNITSSSLAFRQLSDVVAANNIHYEQGQHDWFHLVFGCEDEKSSLQDVGSVNTKEGRLITFPNILQHKVQPFSLEDETKPGHRKILALFLVDPHVRVISTACVPAQQREWWREELEVGMGGLLSLPLELRDEVFAGVEEFPIKLEEAKVLREELMAERKQFVLENDNVLGSLKFSLCEH
ncbi:hypothetical protein FA15DRAFT_666299 [Coprinopsis marcescibilis]|uniref:Uncharacterized protein n=1 Tax=Coprinopsis marcescibilis TaxID=230819 RepID=A0A5C3L4K6_COPMA|nr:hypothetical protein FA15DRAFT_666299 [Coprinopsis marcescibilis]